MTIEKPSNYRWVVLSTWISSHVIGFVVVTVLGVLLPAISEEMRLSPARQGILGSAGAWGNLALAIPLAMWASRFRPKMLTTVTLALGTGVIFLQGWAPGFALLLVARMAAGIMLTARRAAFALLIHQWFPAREFVLANGVVNLLFGVTLALGYFATPLILDAAGGSWRSTLYVFGVVSAAGTAVWFIFGRERAAPPKPSEEEKRDRERNVLWAVLRYKELWFCALGFLGAQTAWAAFANFLPTLMLDYDVSLGWSGNLLAINAFMSAVSGLFIGWLISKWNITGAVIVLCGVVLTATLSGMVLTGSLPLLLLADIVNGAAWGFWPVLMSLPFQLKGIKPREIAVALAFFDTSLLLAGTIGPALAGLLQEVTGELRTALVITGVLALALSIAGLLLTAGRSLPSRQTAVGGD